jgi:hypothetical protein
MSFDFFKKSDEHRERRGILFFSGTGRVAGATGLHLQAGRVLAR